jgi:mRNA-degrading endonuclease RelE of RelBE toxin-antitoxin system
VTIQEKYTFRLPDDIVVLVRKLHPVLKANIRRALQLIGQNPYAGKLLKDELENLRGYRVKKCRVIYRILDQDKIIEIVVIGPRKRIYEETFHIMSKEVKATITPGQVTKR